MNSSITIELASEFIVVEAVIDTKNEGIKCDLQMTIIKPDPASWILRRLQGMVH